MSTRPRSWHPRPAAKACSPEPVSKDDADAGVVVEGLKGALEVVEHLRVQGMQNVRAIQRNGGDHILYIQQQRFVTHIVPSRVIQSTHAHPDDTIELMIKGITLVAQVASGDAFDKLGSLFAALGFEPGKGWTDATGRGLPSFSCR